MVEKSLIGPAWKAIAVIEKNRLAHFTRFLKIVRGRRQTLRDGVILKRGESRFFPLKRKCGSPARSVLIVAKKLR